MGKILRINADGSIPIDNPFYNQASGKNRAIWALGLRNPFTFAFQPLQSQQRMFINDVGQNTFEEINEGSVGANYGWPDSEGPTTTPGHTGPIYSYGHGGGACAITGGAFYNPLVATFPSNYLGDYFFADYCAGWIKRRDDSGSIANFASGISLPVDLQLNPDGSLHYLARGGGGVVYRIEYTSNQAPAITQHPSDVTVTLGQPATFSVTATGNPAPTYQWQRNQIDIPGATASSYTIASVTGEDHNDLFRCHKSSG